MTADRPPEIDPADERILAIVRRWPGAEVEYVARQTGLSVADVLGAEDRLELGIRVEGSTRCVYPPPGERGAREGRRPGPARRPRIPDDPEALAARRDRLDLTQAEVARRLAGRLGRGVDTVRSTLSTLERRGLPDTESSRALLVELEQLLDELEHPESCPPPPASPVVPDQARTPPDPRVPAEGSEVGGSLSTSPPPVPDERPATAAAGVLALRAVLPPELQGLSDPATLGAVLALAWVGRGGR